MLTKGKSLASRLYAWNMLTQNLRPDLQRFPHLAGDLEELAAMHAEASALVSELARLRGQAQQATSRLRKLARRGDMLRTRMGAGLKGSLGFESIDLIKYGFRPRRSPGSDDDVDALRRNDTAETAGGISAASSDEGSGEQGEALLDQRPTEIADGVAGELAHAPSLETSAEPS